MTTITKYDREEAKLEFENAVAATRTEGARGLGLYDIAEVLYKELGADIEPVITRLNTLVKGYDA